MSVFAGIPVEGCPPGIPQEVRPYRATDLLATRARPGGGTLLTIAGNTLTLHSHPVLAPRQSPSLTSRSRGRLYRAVTSEGLQDVARRIGATS